MRRRTVSHHLLRTELLVQLELYQKTTRILVFILARTSCRLVVSHDKRELVCIRYRLIIRLVRLVCILNLQNTRHGFKSVTAISFKFYSQCSPQADYLAR